MAPNYNNGKIYKLNCSDGHFYIGSTVASLSVRMNGHKQCAKTHPERTVYKHCLSIGWDDVDIELIEDYPCNSHKELVAREDYYIQQNKTNLKCLNIKRSHVTPEERKEQVQQYYQAHRDEIIQSNREYVEENREIVTERRAKYRKENAEVLREKARKYAKDHPEWKKESRRKHYEENKELVKEQCKKYSAEHKEQIATYKAEWARKKRAEIAEATAEARAKKATERKEKTAERKAREKITVDCDCGGTYQQFHRHRHFASKMHTKYVTANEIVTPPESTSA